MEKKIKFESEGFFLEGLLSTNSMEKAVIITHPHPLYGGEMHNPVVGTIKDAYLAKDFTTLRFNFRGAGYSQGSHDDGIGEQEDVLAAFTYLANLGISDISLAGYSFGAWVNLMVAYDSAIIKKLILVSPPVDFIKFKTVENIASLKLVVTGTNDTYASVSSISELIKDWNKDAYLKEVAGADHFYSGKLQHLKEILLAHL